jgi:hypothetical protein
MCVRGADRDEREGMTSFVRPTKKRSKPVLADRIDVTQIREHAVFDGLRAGVGIDHFAEQVSFVMGRAVQPVRRSVFGE